MNVVCALIRGKDIEMATAILQHTPKAASEYLIKLVKSAAANAENNHGMDPSKLYVSAAYADAGMINQAVCAPVRMAAAIASTKELLASPSW